MWADEFTNVILSEREEAQRPSVSRRIPTLLTLLELRAWSLNQSY